MATMRYRFLVSQHNLNVGAYGNPVTVVAESHKQAVRKALHAAGLDHGNVKLREIEEVEQDA